MKTKEQILQGSTVTILYADFEELTKRSEEAEKLRTELDSLRRRILGGMQVRDGIGPVDVKCHSLIEIPENCDDPWLRSIRERFLNFKRR